MKDKFNANKYKQEYNKEHYKTFKVDLRIEEMQQLEEHLEKIGLTKAQFLRDSIENLRTNLGQVCIKNNKKQ